MTSIQALKRTAIVAMACASFAGISAVRAGEIRATTTERRSSVSVRDRAGDEMFDVGGLYRAARREIAEHFEQIVDVLARRR